MKIWSRRNLLNFKFVNKVCKNAWNSSDFVDFERKNVKKYLVVEDGEIEGETETDGVGDGEVLLGA